ncbi:MAG TPA: SPOR domain-containing protein [Thermoanaerobaculia bacterium]
MSAISEEPITDDQSHYEVSLTAGQAFLAFVLLLLSLAASFAFGLMIGRGQGDEKLLAQSAPAIVDEAGITSRKPKERIVELGVDDHSFQGGDAPEAEPVKQPARTAPAVTIKEEKSAPPVAAAAKGPAVPHYAQLLSTADQKKAEALAAKLIDSGFLGAYVERATNERGPLFRVRVNFPSEQEARSAEARLKTFSKDVWITRQ